MLRVSEEYRGEHSTVWLSRESARYLAETENPTDKKLANILDEGFMKSIEEFYQKSIANN